MLSLAGVGLEAIISLTPPCQYHVGMGIANQVNMYIFCVATADLRC